MKLNKENLEKYFKPENFFSRDLSWLEFNKRVLEEAMDPQLPVLERIKFISIYFTNLDEFYMIRVSGIKEQIRANIIEQRIDGLTPYEELNFIQKEVIPQVELLLKYWNTVIIPELEENNITFVKYSELNPDEIEKLHQYFNKEIFPVLTPLAFDPGRPFPYISNLSLSLAIQVMKSNGQLHFARLKIPAILPRIVQLDGILSKDNLKSNGSFSAKLIWLEDLIKNNLNELFPGLEIISAHKFRITRNADLNIQEDEADDLLSVIEENIKQRKFGSVVRLAVEKDMPELMINILTENLEISDYEIQVVDGPMGLSSVMSLYDLPLPHLKQQSFYPVLPPVFDDEER